jgi:hypothetical protein
MNAIYSIENGQKMAFELSGSRVVVDRAGKMVKEFKYEGVWKNHPRPLKRHMTEFIERTKRYIEQTGQ